MPDVLEPAAHRLDARAAGTGEGFDVALEVRAELSRRVSRAALPVRVDIARREGQYWIVVEPNGEVTGSLDALEFPVDRTEVPLQVQRVATALRESGLRPSCGLSGPAYHSGSAWCAPV